MSLIQVAGVPAGPPSFLVHPLNGRPWADVTLAATSVPWKAGDQVEVAVQGGVTYTMTVERVGPRGGFASARLMCGTGGLGRDIPSRFYRDIPAATVVRDLLEACGEAVGEINLPGKVPAWVRAAGPAHEALRAVMMRYPDHVWQMTPDGKVHVGIPKWLEHDRPVPVEAEDAAAGAFTVAFNPALRPGLHVILTRGEEELGKRVTRVTHAVEEVPDFPRPEVRLRSLLGTGDGQDGGAAGLEAAIQRAVRWVDYLGLYPCEVIRDHGDHTLDLLSEHPLIPRLTRVRLVQPLPGTRVKLKAGGTVLLSFQGGDPARPVVLHYGACELELMEIVTGRGQVLRVDDDRGDVSPEDERYQRPHISVVDAAGQHMKLWAEPGAEFMEMKDAAGQFARLDPVKGEVNVEAQTTANIRAGAEVNADAPIVNLAGGGPAVARVGDQVQVIIPSGSSAGTYTGTIIKGSSKVFSG